MNQVLFEKKEQFRKEIRKQRNETLFKQKRIIQQNTQQHQGTLEELMLKLKKQEYCDNLLEWFCDLENPVNIFKELLEYLTQAISLSTIQIGMKCINNLLYYFDDIFGKQNDCYEFFRTTFKIDDFTTRSRTLSALGNFLNDNRGFEIDVQNHFFKVDLLPQFTEEYSFIIHVLSQNTQFSDLIKCLQFLAIIIETNPNGTALEAIKFIFERCTPLEADDLVENHYKNTILQLIKLASSNRLAFNALMALLHKANEATKVSLFFLGYDKLIKNFLDNPDLRNYAFQLILPFTHINDHGDENNILITHIFELFEDQKLNHLLIEDCCLEKLLIICNSIKNGSIQIFIEFLSYNIIEKIFIPYLLSEDYQTVQIIIETIDVLLQKDELSASQFQFIVKAFNTEQFKLAIEKRYYDKDAENQDYINQTIDSILNAICQI